jgi:hypothetical protein
MTHALCSTSYATPPVMVASKLCKPSLQSTGSLCRGVESLRAGDEAGARTLFDRTIAPINRLAAQGSGIFYHVHKELLRQRGIIAAAKVRSPAPPVEAMTQRELQQVLADLYSQGMANGQPAIAWTKGVIHACH